jgi:CBS domain-containing protein
VHLVGPEETLSEAARRMRDQRVGTLVVAREDRRPVGLVTDRDLVVRGVSFHADAARVRVEQVMSAPADAVPEDTSLRDALARMRRNLHRRLVVVDADGGLAGILSLDDILERFGEDLALVGELLARP